jgi:hypothetical protein
MQPGKLHRTSLKAMETGTAVTHGMMLCSPELQVQQTDQTNMMLHHGQHPLTMCCTHAFKQVPHTMHYTTGCLSPPALLAAMHAVCSSSQQRLHRCLEVAAIAAVSPPASADTLFLTRYC